MLRIASFYKFVELNNYYDLKDVIFQFCATYNLKGTILIAEEGVNGTVEGEYLEEFFEFLSQDVRLCNLQSSFLTSKTESFDKLVVKLRAELVNFGVENLSQYTAGEYIEYDAWDELISSDRVAVFDVRNTYETDLGFFEAAICPDTKNFRDFPLWFEEWVEKHYGSFDKIAMYCTGGIRCEKSTAYAKMLGFDKVYHLKGGILNYLKAKQVSDKWKGDCFVFDDRVAVAKDLTPVDLLFCELCGIAISQKDLKNVSKAHILCEDCGSI